MSPSTAFLAFTLLLFASAAAAVRDPFSRILASSFDFNEGAIKYHGMGGINSGDRLGYKDLNFSREAIAFEMSINSYSKHIPNRRVELRLDAIDSEPFLILDKFHATVNEYQNVDVLKLIPSKNRPRGVHDLYFTFQGPNTSDTLVALGSFIFIADDDYCTVKTLPPKQCPTQPTVTCNEVPVGQTYEQTRQRLKVSPESQNRLRY